MSHSRFYSFLINHPFGDPGLFIGSLYEKRALLFDIGDISLLSEKQLLRITHIFVTHTHMDHFFGFDRIIRFFLGRNKTLNLYGPPGLVKNIEGKLSGYQWNKLEKFKSNFKIQVMEIHKNYTIVKTYESKRMFKTTNKEKHCLKNNTILSEKDFYVITKTFDHGTPCLGFSLIEKSRINILSNKLKSLGFIPGKWITYLKYCLLNGIEDNIKIELTNGKYKYLSVKKLKMDIVKVSSGQKITYISDVNFTETNVESILKLAYKSTRLFIEATFATEHEAMAMKKYHLTAKQAGRIARMSESKDYTLFHHSCRYIKCPNRLKKEAEIEFSKKIYHFE